MPPDEKFIETCALPPPAVKNRNKLILIITKPKPPVNLRAKIPYSGRITRYRTGWLNMPDTIPVIMF
jgi:hypothetical protein